MAESEKAKDIAEKAPTAAVAEKTPADAAPAKSSAAPTFAVSDLVSRSTKWLGEPAYVVAGALHGASGRLSIDEAKSRVGKFLAGAREA